MSKLYDTNSYEKTFTAEVLSVTQKEDFFHILLDQTAFYPGDVGISGDIGFIEDCPITHVYEENSLIYHVSPKKLIKIHKVKCTIDWEKRFDAMQQCLSQHMLSAYLAMRLNATTLNFQLGESVCSLDSDKPLAKEDLMQVELDMNQLIHENLPIEIYFPTKQELKKPPFNKLFSKQESSPRIVKIGDLAPLPCFGLYPHATLELQLFKLLSCEKHKSVYRLTFVSGERAVKTVLSQAHFAQEICHMLKSDEKAVFEKITTLSQEFNKLQIENGNLKNTIANYEVHAMLEQAPSIGSVRLIKHLYTDLSLKDAQILGNKLSAASHVIVLLGLKIEEQAYLLFMRSKDLKKISMDTLLKDSITLIDGRGGGNDFSAQGAGKSLNNLESALAYAFMKIQGQLNASS